jgi:tRNA-splicing endonuclease subunit Sen34
VIEITNHYDFIKYHEKCQGEKEYKVYKNLKEKNFYVTLGFKYGADFLVYQDDPNFIHSEFIINVYDELQEINVKELIYGERLGVNTKKKYMIATVNENNISYTNFEWQNIL